MNPAETLARFDDFLVDRSLSLDAVVLGGAALALLGLVARATKDCDVLDPALPPPIIEAARAFCATAGLISVTAWRCAPRPKSCTLPGLGSSNKTPTSSGLRTCALPSTTSRAGSVMAPRRHFPPRATLVGDALSAAMAGVGMNIAAAPAPDPNLEDTVYFASEEGLLRDDLRTLSVLTTWLAAHGERLDVARLAWLVRVHPSPRVRAYWAAVGAWPATQRFGRLARTYEGPRLELLAVGTDFHVRRHGEDPRFARSALVVPANVLRDRASDVLAPAELAIRHRPYRYRVLVGPGPRADLWAALEANPSLSTAVLARRAYSSFALASEVRRDWAIVHPNQAPSHRARVA